MAAFLTALANIGNQYGTAKTDAADAMAKRQQQAQELQMGLARLGAEQANQKLAQQRFEFEKNQALRPIPIKLQDGSTQYWLPDKGHMASAEERKALNIPDEKEPESLIETGASMLSGIKDPDIRVQTEQLMSSLYRANPYATPAERAAMLEKGQAFAKSEMDKKEATRVREDEKATATQERKDAAAQREQDRREDAATNAQRAYELHKMLIDFQLNAKMRYMTGPERQLYESIKTVEPMVDKLSKFIVDNKLTQENDWIFGNRSALMQHLRMRGYSAGIKQDAVSQELIKDAAAISVMGAAPWMKMGRGRYMFETVQQHLPKPTDTPALLYDKVTWLRDNVLADAKDGLAGLTPPGGGPPIGSETGPTDIPAVAAPVSPDQPVTRPSPQANPSAPAGGFDWSAHPKAEEGPK